MSEHTEQIAAKLDGLLTSLEANCLRFSQRHFVEKAASRLRWQELVINELLAACKEAEAWKVRLQGDCEGCGDDDPCVLCVLRAAIAEAKRGDE